MAANSSPSCRSLFSKMAKIATPAETPAPGQVSLPRSGLPADIAPAARSELVDLADAGQLAKFGLNVNPNWDTNTLSEKWEGLAMLRLNDPDATNDFLLLVGNDNDF